MHFLSSKLHLHERRENGCYAISCYAAQGLKRAKKL